MSIWNKVLVGLIGVISLVFFYMATRTLKTHAYWRELAQKYEARIGQIHDENIRLVEGVHKEGEPAQPGIRQVQLELHKLLLNRRRAWTQCDPKIKLGREDGTAEVNVTIGSPAPHGISDKAKIVLYAFEDADTADKGQYLGEFTITKVADKQVALVPTARLTPREIERLDKAKRPWNLYEVMPRDDHEIFAEFSDEQKKKMLSADSISEYLKDGKPAAQDDLEECVVDGKYVRPLRDYQVRLNAEREKRTFLADSIEAAVRDKKLVEDALVEGRKQEESSQKDVVASTKDVAKFARQREIVATHRKNIEEKLDAMRAAIARLIESNQAMAGQIAKMQLEAARRIDQRTRAMAQSGTGRQ